MNEEYTDILYSTTALPYSFLQLFRSTAVLHTALVFALHMQDALFSVS